MSEKWRNWSGSLTFRPGRFVEPETEEALQELVHAASRRGEALRVVGAGHSSTPLVVTADTSISLGKFEGVQSADREACEAWVAAGTTIHEMGKQLLQEGLAVHNLGDVDVQRIGGALGTGTHGSGFRLQNLSTMLLGVRMVGADGEVAERNIETEPEFIRAARVALGTLGIFTSVRLKLLPRYQLHRQEWCTSVEACLDHLGELVEQNRNFDFYWYPRSDQIKLRTLNPPGQAPQLHYADLLNEVVDWAPNVISKTRELRFDEIEYAMPAEAGPEVFCEVRRRIKERHLPTVGWRTLYRTTAADDAYLSNAYGRQTVTLSLHQNAGLPFQEFFDDIEPIFRAHHGRPHWAKKHGLCAEQLAPLYPQWGAFREMRRRVDPDGRFMTPYMRELLGEVTGVF